ncbi:MAG: VapE domain-containing protein, partial [Deltaproteobacteria bacterium]
YDLKENNFTLEEAVAKLQKATLDYEGELNSEDIFHIEDIYFNRRVDANVSVARRIRGVTDGMSVENIFTEYSKQLNVAYLRDENVITTTISGVTEKYTPSQFESRLLLDLDHSGLVEFDKDLIKRRIGLFIDEEDRKHLARTKEHVSYDSNADEMQIEKFVSLLCGEVNPNHELDVAVLKHFIWQVKRKLNDLPVDHHMMPVVVGPQGIGKSVVILKLLEPIKDLVGNPPDLATLGDAKNSSFLFRHYVLFFDEMARAQRADINKLKNLISSATIEYRPLYSNSIDKRKNTATFIGASNNGVADNINDPTGMRRFWEINARKNDEQWHETSNDVWRQ